MIFLIAIFLVFVVVVITALQYTPAEVQHMQADSSGSGFFDLLMYFSTQLQGVEVSHIIGLLLFMCFSISIPFLLIPYSSEK